MSSLYNRHMIRAERAPQTAAPEYSFPKNARIPFRDLNVFEQPRKTFTQIEEMALSIARYGLFNPLLVAQVNLEQAQEYIGTINKIWGTKHSTDEFISNSVDGNRSPSYLILIGGERRLRALKLLDTIGCLDHQEKYGLGPCMSRHPQFGDKKKVRSTLITNFDTWNAIFTQLIENIHERVPHDEEAIAYDLIFGVRKSEDPTLTIAEFARKVGRNPDIISQALRFARLPEDIREHVRKGKLPYGMAVEIARARETLKLNDVDLQYWVARASVHKRVEDFRKIVSTAIEASRQTDLGIFTAQEDEEMKRSGIRRTAARELVMGAWNHLHYIEKLSGLIQTGMLKKTDSPLSVQSPLRALRATIGKLELIQPFLEEQMSQDELERIRKTIEDNKVLIEILIPQIPDEPIGLPLHEVVFSKEEIPVN